MPSSLAGHLEDEGEVVGGEMKLAGEDEDEYSPTPAAEDVATMDYNVETEQHGMSIGSKVSLFDLESSYKTKPRSDASTFDAIHFALDLLVLPSYIEEYGMGLKQRRPFIEDEGEGVYFLPLMM